MSDEAGKSLSRDLKDASESATVIMSGRKFQVVGAVKWKARSEKVILWNGTDKLTVVSP